MSDLFKTHLLNEKGIEKARSVGDAFDSLLTTLVGACPDGRELALVKTKLEEACFFAKKAIARLPANQVVTLLIALLGFGAFADTAAPVAAPSGFGSIVQGLLTPANVAAGVGGVLALLGGFQFFTAKRKRILALAAFHAFHIVEDIDNEIDDGSTAKATFDKAAAGLKQVDAYLVANGWRPMKPNEQPAAALALQAIHGGEVAKEKLVVAQAEAAVAAQAAVPKPA